MFHPYKIGLSFFLFISALLGQCLHSQSFNPIIINHNKSEYQAASQNWSVAMDSYGYCYAGNNNGMLRYNGNTWQLFTIPGLKTVRSIYVDPNDRIYTGAFEEFGYFKKGSVGIPEYTSISALLDDYELENDEIWNIFEMDGKVIFQSFSSFFVYDGDVVSGFKLSESIIFFMPWKGKIYTYTSDNGLCFVDLEDGSLKQILGYSSKSPAISILPYDEDQALLFTLDDGIYIFDGNKTDPFLTESTSDLIKGKVNKVIRTSDSCYVIGTLLKGLYIIGIDGKLKWHIGTEQGLQNNTILGLCTDEAKNIWVALDKGVSMLKLSSSLRFFNQFNTNIGAIYDVQMKDNNLLLGTNQGLYTCDADNKFGGNEDVQVELYSDINSQVWDISSLNNQFFIGNNEETYELSSHYKGVAAPIKGGYAIKAGMVNGKEILVQGTYSNLCIYKRNTIGKWTYSHTIDEFLNPIRYVEIDYLGTIWASHIHKGLFAIKLENDLMTIKDIEYYNKLGNSENRTINVFKLNNRVVFCNGDIMYTYDDLEEKLVPYDALNSALGVFKTAHKIIYFTENLYWFIRNNEAALVQVTENEISIEDIIPFAVFPSDYVDDYQNIVPVSESSCLFCLENGLGQYNYTAQTIIKDTHWAKLRIEKVKASSRNLKQISLLLPLANDTIPMLDTHQNNIQFTIGFPQFMVSQEVLFSYRLSGVEMYFSDSTSQFIREYDNLNPGKYLFEVKAVNPIGTTLATSSYTFEILKPFYLRWWAIIGYALLFVGIIWFTLFRIKSHFHKKQEDIEAELANKRKLELDQKENQIMRLKNQNLEVELKLKSKELAGSAMSIIRKNEILTQIKTELKLQKEQLGTQYPKKYLNKIVAIIDSNISNEDDWAIFQENFDRIHENFFRNLKTRFPELTAHDLRFCAYLRLNLSSKEIASLINISLKGVETSRYRIRKKLNLSHDESLNDFLVNLK